MRIPGWKKKDSKIKQGLRFLNTHFHEATKLITHLTIGPYETYKADYNKRKADREAKAKLHGYTTAEAAKATAEAIAEEKSEARQSMKQLIKDDVNEASEKVVTKKLVNLRDEFIKNVDSKLDTKLTNFFKQFQPLLSLLQNLNNLESDLHCAKVKASHD